MIREQKTVMVPREKMAETREKLEKKGLHLISENLWRVVYTDGTDYYILAYAW